jgi:hypothetical protein
MGRSSAERDSTSEHTAVADSQLSSIATTRSDKDARRAIAEYRSIIRPTNIKIYVREADLIKI